MSDDQKPTEQERAAKPEPSAKQRKQAAQAEASESVSPFSVTVGRLYEGPLDLLLDLIRKQDIDIYDIPIGKITAQFLAYVEGLKQTDIDAAGDFIYVAALLIQIKSRMLLPREPAEAEGESEDPRRELVERLLEHERFQRAAQMLLQKQQIEEATWTNPSIREFRDAEGTEPEIAADTVDLVRVFRDILDRAKQRPVLNVDEEAVTVAQMLDFVRRRLVMEDKPIALRSLLKNTRSERALICMFLALLEMVRLQAILLRQDRNFGEVYVKKHESFDAVMDDTMTRLRDDWR
jgi:segregation and condensation protein A